MKDIIYVRLLENVLSDRSERMETNRKQIMQRTLGDVNSL